MNSQTSVVSSAVEATPFFARKLTERQKTTCRNSLIVAAALLVIAVVGTGISHRRTATASSVVEKHNSPLPVSIIAVEQIESYSRARSYTGLLRESRRSQLSFQRSGELVELLVDEGDAVTKGDVLGRLDARHILAARAQLTAQIRVAKAVLAELLEGPRKEIIAAKRAELRAHEAQEKVLEGQVARRQQLLPSGRVSREEYETILFDFEAAQARADVVQRQLEELLAGTRIEQISAQRARLAQLDAQLADIAHDLEDTALLAPFSGRISQRMVDEGTVLNVGAPVLELIDDTELEAWIGMPQRSVAALRVGNSYELDVEGQIIQAKLHSLGPDVDQRTRTRNVILRLPTDQTSVVPGLVVRLEVSENVAEPGFWVPTTALARGTRGLWSLYVVSGAEETGAIARRDVELLDTVGKRSFVRGTLQPGDRVVASGTHRVVVGQTVTTDHDSIALKSL